MCFKLIKTLLMIAVFTGCFSVSAQNNTLQFYQEQALRNSPLLKDYNNQILQARIDSARVRAVYKPQVNLSSSAFIAPVIRGFGYDGSITNVQTLDGLVNVNQSLDGKRYIKAQLKSIGLQADSLQNTSKISEQDLKKSVIGQYITAYGSLQQLEFNLQVNALLTKEEKILKTLTRSNVYRQSDYLTFLVTLQQQNLQLSQSRIQFQNDFATLNYLVGLQDTTTVKLQDPNIQVNYQPDLGNSIFFKQYGLDSLKILNNRRLLDFTYRPRAGVFANGGYNTGFIAPILNNFGTGFGFSLTVPIYDGGQRKLQYKKLGLEEETRQNYRSFFGKQYSQQIAQLQQQIIGNESLITQISEQLKYAQRLVTVDFELMQTGDLRVADLVLAINNYLSAKYLLTQTNISRLQLINQLNYWNR
ncbi:MAG: TolC family protein [Mucilaginibacter sp.]|uniref:TolC family protein n=1 Tax=Mucilaginibacter sp. TaxID=1882438 RepID=UPI0034E3CACA